jgi:hypothetical protein
LLTVDVTPHPTDPTAYASWAATFEDEQGVRYFFTRETRERDRLGRRKLLLTGIDDGIAARAGLKRRHPPV